MTIRNRLTLQFTVITGIILLLVFSAIYLVTALITRNEFFDRLRERAAIAENIYFEKDELTKTIYENFEKKYLIKLPDEAVQIFNDKDQKVNVEGLNIYVENNPSTVYSRQLIEKVRSKETYLFSDFHRRIIGEYYRDNQGDFVIFVSAQDLEGDEHLRKFLWSLIVTYILAHLIIFLSGRFFARNALRPITNVVHQVQKISASNLHLRVHKGKHNDEIAELAITFNDMLSRLESTFEMQRTFVSNASHELRTPLTSIIGELEVFLNRERSPQEYRDAMQSVLNDAQQMNELTTGLLNIAQIDFDRSEIKIEEIRIDELLVEIEKEIMIQHPQATILSGYANLPEDASKLIIKGNRQLLSVALSNLFHNAIKFSDNAPVQCNLRYINDHIEVLIIDEGIGIAEDEIGKVFQPFYRSQQARNFAGHGVGLALVEKILQLHKIRINVVSMTGKGTQVTLVFDSP